MIPASVVALSISSHGDPPFEHIIVDAEGPSDPWAKIIADIDGDGALDIVIGGRKGPLVYYRNPDWTKYLIADGGYRTVDGEAGDMDGDGDSDIVMGGIIWYENQLPSRNPNSGPWEQHLIADHPTHDVELADLDGDGDLDVVTRDQSAFSNPRGNELHIWVQDVNGWKNLMLRCTHGEGLAVADLDLDGDMDIVLDGVVFENLNQNPLEAANWTERPFATWHHSACVAVGDIDGDMRPDIVLTPAELRGGEFRISWFRTPPTLEGKWTEHIVDLPVETVYHSVQLADMNGDGFTDIVTAEMHQGRDPDEVAIYYNRINGTEWRKQVISETGSHLVQVGDINGDDIPDLMGANWSGPYQPIELWINQAPQDNL